MGVIWTNRTRTRQPRDPAPLAAAFSGADGFAWTPSFVASGAGSEVAVKGSTVTRPTAGELAAFATSATDAQRVRGRTGIKFNKTLFVFRFIYTGSTTSFTFGYGDNGVPSFYVEQLDVNMDESGSSSTGKFRFVYRDTAGGNLACAPTTAILSAGVINTLVLGVSSGSTVVGWLNGASLAFNYSSTGASDANAGLPNKEWAILNFNYGSGNAWGGFSGADTNLGASLVARINVDGFGAGRALSLSPWQIFAPEKRPVFYSIAGVSPGGSGTANRIMLLRRPGLSRIWR